MKIRSEISELGRCSRKKFRGFLKDLSDTRRKRRKGKIFVFNYYTLCDWCLDVQVKKEPYDLKMILKITKIVNKQLINEFQTKSTCGIGLLEFVSIGSTTRRPLSVPRSRSWWRCSGSGIDHRMLVSLNHSHGRRQGPIKSDFFDFSSEIVKHVDFIVDYQFVVLQAEFGSWSALSHKLLELL